MFSAAILSALHLLALALGFGGLAGRALAFQHTAQQLRQTSSQPELKWLFWADNLWGVAALLWISSGLYRLFAALEKSSSWYLGHSLFWVKMGLFALIFLLELPIMLRLLRWRLTPPTALQPEALQRDARWSYLELALLILMVFTAALMARGVAYQLWF